MQEKQKSSWWEVFGTFFWALLIAMIFRTLLFQPFHIPSGSMKPTLLVGDYLIVSKYSYGYSRYSMPFGPHIFDGRMWYTEPKRGDIIVFKVPKRKWGEDVLIKRLIGLPGDEIQVKDAVLYVNDKAVELQDDGVFHDRDYDADDKRLVETLPGGKKHWILDLGPSHYDGYNHIDPHNTPVYKVPEGEFFMMGDNRDNSSDSRFELGPVPAENLIGRAEIMLFASGESWSPLSWDYKRFFTWLN